MSQRFPIIPAILLLFSSCNINNPEHLPDVHSKEVEKEILRSYFPSQRRNWIATSGNSPYIIGQCPVVNSGDKYITITYKLPPGLDPGKIALLNVFMEKKEDTGNGYVWRPVADKYFLPDSLNLVKIKNTFPIGEYKLWYGFFLKQDSLEQYPRLHKHICYMKIE